MAKTCGFSVRKYRYYHEPTKSLDFDGMVHDLEVSYTKKII